MNQRAGFTIVELTITITIMVILLTLGVVNLRSTQANARDEDRKTDASNIALHLEDFYLNGTEATPAYKGAYPPVAAANTPASIELWFTTIDKQNLRAPDVTAPAYSIVPATNNNQTITGIRPLPTTNTYVYQPLTGTNTLCTVQADCRKFNLFYQLETQPAVQRILSKNQ